jgi:hypothetical protein
MSLPLVARRHRIARNQLFTRRLYTSRVLAAAGAVGRACAVARSLTLDAGAAVDQR